MPYSSEEVLPDGHLLLYAGRDDGRHSEGVGMVIAKRVTEESHFFISYSSRIMTGRFYSKQVNVTVVVAYTPTEVSKISEKAKFYDLNIVHNQIP